MKTASLIIIILLFSPFVVGLLSIIVYSINNKNSTHPIQALLIHSVSNSKKLGISYLKQSVFEDFISELNRRGLKTCSLSDAILDFKRNSKCESIPLIFDDGFKDFYTIAFPILKKYNFKATIYPVSNTLSNNNISWDIYSNAKHLSANDIKEIADSGFEIGSHTASHPDLTRLPADAISHELRDSKKSLEICAKNKIVTLSFPFGSWNEEIWNIAQELGYTNAVAYRNHSNCLLPIIPSIGTYSFDTVDTILQKVGIKKINILTAIKSAIIPHFAKGSSLWNFRKIYLTQNNKKF